MTEMEHPDHRPEGPICISADSFSENFPVFEEFGPDELDLINGINQASSREDSVVEKVLSLDLLPEDIQPTDDQTRYYRGGAVLALSVLRQIYSDDFVARLSSDSFDPTDITSSYGQELEFKIPAYNYLSRLEFQAKALQDKPAFLQDISSEAILTLLSLELESQWSQLIDDSAPNKDQSDVSPIDKDDTSSDADSIYSDETAPEQFDNSMYKFIRAGLMDMLALSYLASGGETLDQRPQEITVDPAKHFVRFDTYNPTYLPPSFEVLPMKDRGIGVTTIVDDRTVGKFPVNKWFLDVVTPGEQIVSISTFDFWWRSPAPQDKGISVARIGDRSSIINYSLTGDDYLIVETGKGKGYLVMSYPFYVQNESVRLVRLISGDRVVDLSPDYVYQLSCERDAMDRAMDGIKDLKAAKATRESAGAYQAPANVGLFRRLLRRLISTTAEIPELAPPKPPALFTLDLRLLKNNVKK